MRFLLIILCIFVSSGYSSYSNEIQEIEWSKYRKLSWSDFTKVEKDFSPLFEALTSTSLVFSYDQRGDEFHFNIYSVFIPSKSWVRKDKQISELLEHEQLHFDITEIWTRELVKMFRDNEIAGGNYDDVLQDFYQTAAIGVNMMHDEYDEQTHHSTDGEQQEKWNKFVKDELKRLEAYADGSFFKYIPNS